MKIKHCPEQISLKAFLLGTMFKFNVQNKY